jgi:leucyl/phenylalanyl-tRNA---protein transferase
MTLTLLDPKNPLQLFPPIEHALSEPDGLLALGGCLSVGRLVNAYRRGIFPWYNPGDPILWWSPDPRLVLFPEHLHISKSMSKLLKKSLYNVTFDKAFKKTMLASADLRGTSNGTWISQEMVDAYFQLHKMGLAHSIEVWDNEVLVGGLYGVAIGRVFFGESMFHARDNASKIAFIQLVNWLKEWKYQIIDCQVKTDHLLSLGAEEISRSQFQAILKENIVASPLEMAWQS